VAEIPGKGLGEQRTYLQERSIFLHSPWVSAFEGLARGSSFRIRFIPFGSPYSVNLLEPRAVWNEAPGESKEK